MYLCLFATECVRPYVWFLYVAVHRKPTGCWNIHLLKTRLRPHYHISRLYVPGDTSIKAHTDTQTNAHISIHTHTHILTLSLSYIHVGICVTPSNSLNSSLYWTNIHYSFWDYFFRNAINLTPVDHFDMLSNSDLFTIQSLVK